MTIVTIKHRSHTALQWRHNERDGVSNHQPHDCLLNRLFGRRSNKHQSSASLAFVRGINRWPVNSPHKGPVTRKMFPFDDVSMESDTYDGPGCSFTCNLQWYIIMWIFLCKIDFVMKFPMKYHMELETWKFHTQIYFIWNCIWNFIQWYNNVVQI